MPCRANASSVNQVGLDAATISVLFFVTGGVSFCSGVDAPEVLDSEPKVTPPSLVYTPSDLTSSHSTRERERAPPGPGAERQTLPPRERYRQRAALQGSRARAAGQVREARWSRWPALSEVDSHSSAFPNEP